MKDGLTARGRANLEAALGWDARKLRTMMLGDRASSESLLYDLARRLAKRAFRLHPELRG